MVMKTQKANFPDKLKMLFLDHFFKDESVVFRDVSENCGILQCCSVVSCIFRDSREKKLELFKSSVIWHEKNL